MNQFVNGMVDSLRIVDAISLLLVSNQMIFTVLKITVYTTGMFLLWVKVSETWKTEYTHAHKLDLDVDKAMLQLKERPIEHAIEIAKANFYLLTHTVIQIVISTGTLVVNVGWY